MFPNDTIPDIFMFKEKKVNLVNEYRYTFEGITTSMADSKLINVVTEDKIKRNLDARRISLDTFNQMLYNVRIAEGYSLETALYEVHKVDKMNKYLIENNSNCKQSISYFKEYEFKKNK